MSTRRSGAAPADHPALEAGPGPVAEVEVPGLHRAEGARGDRDFPPAGGHTGTGAG
ncbi:hypothetical protein ACIQM3_08985 [Streptomyces sp. NPDC091271]|uniref:hypothetical protein n=1 Tax=Streptomyces sp. NPDC091271 TaxID=3365980 RepID=UPI0038019A29